MIYTGLWCGRCEQCLGGQQSECVQFGIVGVNIPGTFAQKVAVPEQNCSPSPQAWLDRSRRPPGGVPDGLADAHRRGRLSPGETVLVHGIGGGVAVAASNWRNASARR